MTISSAIHTYHSRVWLVPENISSFSTHTCGYIFCHYGYDNLGELISSIRIADCQNIFILNIPTNSVKRTIQRINILLSTIEDKRSRVLMREYKVSYLESSSSDMYFGQFRIDRKKAISEDKYSWDSNLLYIHADPETASKEEFEYKIQIIYTELKLFKEFILGMNKI
jgi:hypothetical protein